MGKSTALCFNFITCASGGGDSINRDGVQATAQCKDSSDRHGWSFRKRSARHRVLSNSVVSEAPSSANKEIPDNTAINFSVQPDVNAPEKTSVVNGTGDKVQLTSQLDSKLSATIDIKEDKSRDATNDESSIVIIQAAVRGLLAQQVLLKQKNITKLQAAVRRYLVRRYAVGTLRCVLAIIKMQALVRAHRSLSDKKEARPSGRHTFVSSEKLLNNAFACKLMESTRGPINIKCEPSKTDTAWKWLERWTSVSSVNTEKPLVFGSASEMAKENFKHSDGKIATPVPSNCYTEPTDASNSGVSASPEPPKNNERLISHNPNNLDSLSFKSSPPLSSDSQLHCINQSSKFNAMEAKEAALVGEVKVNYYPMEEINWKNEGISNYFSTEKPEAEGKKAFSRKASNPAFIAAQSKFEELSSAVNATKFSISSIHDHGVESSSDKVSSATKQLLSSVNNGEPDFTLSNTSGVQIGGSDCGTELSVSSILDPLKRSETGINVEEQETEVLDSTSCCSDREISELKASEMSVMLDTDQSCTNSAKIERDESVNSVTGKCLDPEKKSEAGLRDWQLVPEASLMVNESSLEAFPRCHTTHPEAETSSSNLVAVKPKKHKGKKAESHHKNLHMSADTKSPSNSPQDSASKSNSEKLQEHKISKKWDPVGSEKADHKEHPPRDSSSINPLPSYMQATESARAKAIANGSPRSSPDVPNKDKLIKKRHSLPGANERQGSPGIQRPVSQAQQVVKGNGTYSPQERKWRR